MKFIGNAILKRQDLSKLVMLELDLANGSLVATFPNFESSFCWNSAYFSENNIAVLKKVNLASIFGSLYAEEINGLRILSYHPGNLNYFSSVTNILCQFSPRVGVTTIKLSPKSSYIDLELKKKVMYPKKCKQFSDYEYTFCGNILNHLELNIPINSNSVQIVAEDNIIVLKSKQELKEKEITAIKLVMSLVIGAILRRLVSININKIRFYFSGTYSKVKGYSIYKDPKDVEVILKTTLDKLFSLSENEHGKFLNAFTMLLTASTSPVDVNVNILPLFTVAEIFDNSTTISPNTLQSLLGISPADAKMLNKVRNDMIHNGASISAAVRKAEQELKQHNQVFTEFKVLKDDFNLEVSFFFRFYKLLVKAVLSQLGYNGSLEDFSYMLSQFENE